MIGGPKFTPGGEYLINSDRDRAAALLSFVRRLAVGGIVGISETLLDEAHKLANEVEQARWVIEISYYNEADEKGTREMNILTRHDDHLMATDAAIDAFYDWANDQGGVIQIDQTRILSRNDR